MVDIEICAKLGVACTPLRDITEIDRQSRVGRIGAHLEPCLHGRVIFLKTNGLSFVHGTFVFFLECASDSFREFLPDGFAQQIPTGSLQQRLGL